MATIDVKANVNAPSEINIQLVRADHHRTSNVFRLFFEAFLAVFSGILGVTLSMSDEDKSFHIAVLVIFGLAVVAFAACTLYYHRQARLG